MAGFRRIQSFAFSRFNLVERSTWVMIAIHVDLSTIYNKNFYDLHQEVITNFFSYLTIIIHCGEIIMVIFCCEHCFSF